MSEGDKNRHKLPRDISKEGKYATEADQEGEEQEGYEEEGDLYNRNCYVTVMIFTCYMIFLCFY